MIFSSPAQPGSNRLRVFFSHPGVTPQFLLSRYPRGSVLDEFILCDNADSSSTVEGYAIIVLPEGK